MQSFLSFLRPRISTTVLALMLFGIAAVLLFVMIGCALDGSGRCPVPAAVQAPTLFLLWPAVAPLMFLGNRAGASEGVVFGMGLVLLLLWLYLIACTVRWAAAHVRRKKNHQPPR